jgi:predicted esterase
VRDAGIEIADADPADPRLSEAGPEPSAWQDERGLLIAVRRPGFAPWLVGTVAERLRPAGDGVWALQLRLPRATGACIDYALYEPDAAEHVQMRQWRDRAAPPAAARTPTPVGDAQAIHSSEIGERHPVRLWSPPAPEALVVCADGEGLASWAAVIAAAGERVALVGVDAAGRRWVPGDDAHDWKDDPRARAYLRDADAAYFDEHLRYVIEQVIPWAEAQVGRLPRFVFGVSNGAAWAAQAAAMHPSSFAGVLAFSIGIAPSAPPSRSAPSHALVAGRFEPGFDAETRRYARRLRRRGVRVRLRRPARGHDHSMWVDELVPALRWLREAAPPMPR